ncbi:hypothetical protein [Citrobacter koseri]|uniref:hypothetical protein n=1 Tax=Citrobacter koseri TaxID=545 RepID=UPI001903D2CA|nr:hypothetical protein [Citrobacter koseri]MBJ9237171.1 hypothetical protein [Citrobacter koseri]
MAIGRHFRAEREFRADDRRKRYDIDEQELVLKIAESIPGDDRLSAISQAAGMLRQVKNMNDGTTPVADAVDALLEERTLAGLNRDGSQPA